MRAAIMFKLITLGAGVPAFFLTPIVFPPSPSGAQPGPELVPFILVLNAAESLFFGVGVAFLVLGFPMMQRVARITDASPWTPYLAIGYLTTSWWPHMRLHAVASPLLEKLLIVDFMFHLPHIVAAASLATFLFRTLQASSRASTRPHDARSSAAVLRRAAA
jgi:hypothetical protein